MVKIITDSTADIPSSLVQELGITVVPSYVNFGTQSYLDGVELSRQQFYERLASSREIPSTAAPPPAFYERAYREAAAETEDIISIHVSTKYSGIYSAARVGASEVEGANIAVIDSANATMGHGWIVVAAAEAAQRGASYEEILALVDSMIPKVWVLAALGTLEFLYRGGRVGWAQALVGTLLRIKPILEIRMGEINLLERARTTKTALSRLLALVRELGPLERAIVLHTDAHDLASDFADELQKLDPGWKRLIGHVGVTIASHAGPGTVGVACVLR